MPRQRLTQGRVDLETILTGFDDVLRQLEKFDPSAVNRKSGQSVARGVGRIKRLRMDLRRELLRNWCEDFEAQYDPPAPPERRRGRSGRRR